MGIISVEQADRLYWLGRYTERVYTTLRFYFPRFDNMIDEVVDSYQAFCESIDIPNIYSSKEDFLRRYPLMQIIRILSSVILIGHMTMPLYSGRASVRKHFLIFSLLSMI